MRLHVLLCRVWCLWFALFYSSVALPNVTQLQEWLRKCNCSCLLKSAPKQPKAGKLLSNCATRQKFTIDEEGFLKNSHTILSHENAARARFFTCKTTNLKDEKGLILLNLRCKGIPTYVIYKQKGHELEISSLFISSSHPTTGTTKPGQKNAENNSGEPSKRLVIGLSIGLALLTVIIVCWISVCWRRRRKKPDEKQQTPEFGYIDEEEDSAPYRIVDLQTNISCDASGYTFLEAPKEEEKPYQKLQPRCARVDNKKEFPEKEHSYEAVADEPVYFLLEGKEASTNTAVVKP